MGVTKPAAIPAAGRLALEGSDVDDQLRALRYRAWHRGTREADLMIGGFFDRHHGDWGPDERTWFADLLAEQDVDIMAWGIGTAEAPKRFQGPMLDAFQKLDFLPVAR
jgi:antitoxin CptB